MYIEALFWGILVSILTSSLILVSLARNPRIWIGDAPPEMQTAVEPLTPEEKRQRLLWGIPIIISMLIILPLIAIWRNQTYDFTYIEAFLFLWIGSMVFNVVDLLIIDWLVLVWWKPAWSQLPEVAHLSHHNNYRFHFVGFLKGVVLVTGWSGLVALLFLVI